MVYDLRKPNEFIRIEVDVVRAKPPPQKTKSLVLWFIKNRVSTSLSYRYMMAERIQSQSQLIAVC
jgi:hypothetical protein